VRHCERMAYNICRAGLPLQFYEMARIRVEPDEVRAKQRLNERKGMERENEKIS
jgi:hypothetical protein